MRYLLGGALAIAAALVVYSMIPPAEPVPPPSAEVRTWVERCINPNNNCNGDIIFLKGGDEISTAMFDNSQEFQPRIINFTHLRTLEAHGRLGTIGNVVTANDPNFQAAFRHHFNRTNE